MPGILRPFASPTRPGAGRRAAGFAPIFHERAWFAAGSRSRGLVSWQRFRHLRQRRGRARRGPARPIRLPALPVPGHQWRGAVQHDQRPASRRRWQGAEGHGDPQHSVHPKDGHHCQDPGYLDHHRAQPAQRADHRDHGQGRGQRRGDPQLDCRQPRRFHLRQPQDRRQLDRRQCRAQHRGHLYRSGFGDPEKGPPQRRVHQSWPHRGADDRARCRAVQQPRPAGRGTDRRGFRHLGLQSHRADRRGRRAGLCHPGQRQDRQWPAKSDRQGRPGDNRLRGHRRPDADQQYQLVQRRQPAHAGQQRHHGVWRPAERWYGGQDHRDDRERQPPGWPDRRHHDQGGSAGDVQERDAHALDDWVQGSSA